jgi:hypothetical protein
VSALDLGATLRALHEAGVDVILTGGVAVAAYEHLRGTEDRAIEVEAFGIPLRVIGKADLLAAERARGEPRDLDDLEALGG